MLTKLTETTKVKMWLDRINELVDATNSKNYSWDTVSIKNQSSYTFNTSQFMQMPINAEYVVYYSGIELHKDDYSINGNVLKFTSPPEEDGCSIRVRCLRLL
jgi:hypothetical protein